MMFVCLFNISLHGRSSWITISPEINPLPSVVTTCEVENHQFSIGTNQLQMTISNSFLYVYQRLFSLIFLDFCYT